MTSQTLRRSLTVVILGSLVLAGFMVFQGFRDTVPSAFAPPPTPNGYDDFLKASQLLAGPLIELTNTNADVMQPLVERNRDALAFVHTVLGRECQVPLQLNTNYLAAHMNELGSLKELARLLVAEGRMAEADGKFKEATQTYLDVIRFAQGAARGGLIIDELVAQAIRALGAKNLYRTRDHLTSPECRDLIQVLEAIDRNGEPLEMTFHRERAYFRKVYGWWLTMGPRLVSLINGVDPVKTANQGAEVSILRGQAQLRLLVVHLALHGDKLEHGRYPENLAEMVPKYLSVLPKDPFGGRDLVFRIEDAAAYRLYSIGPDLKDDGGKPLGARRGGQVPQGDIILD